MENYILENPVELFCLSSVVFVFFYKGLRKLLGSSAASPELSPILK